MDVEQRHDAEGDIGWSQRVCGCDVGCRREQVAVSQWHELRAAGGSAGVQDERDVVVARRARSPGAVALCNTLHRHTALAVHMSLDQAYARRHGAARGLTLAGRNDEDPRARVLQIEAELV